ncbi:MAG: DNA adenine methylase [Phycisphaerae bacterium]|nr:DNA adenine methylase [Phycisphaerae bacterium]
MTTSLFPELSDISDRPEFPPTRYLGSKRRLASSIVHVAAGLGVRTVLDAFGGTGAVAHAFKCAGFAVTYNDILRFNHQIGLGLIENDDVLLCEDEVVALGVRRRGVDYGDLVERYFADIYFTDEENRWLDTAAGNIAGIADPYRRALCWFVVFQAAMAKRPYNLFHRRNLYMRHAEVSRSFGNKASWDRSFEDHVRALARQANAAVVRGASPCRATCRDAAAIEPDFDLVYIDPPYIGAGGVGVDYHGFYHFLEGLVDYDGWEERIDFASKHRRLRPETNPWHDPGRVLDCFRALFELHRRSALLVSYRSDGIPSPEELLRALRDFKPRANLAEAWDNQYALSTRRRTKEILLFGV